MAGIIADRSGRVLISRRPPGKHLAGLWEFPGGKRGGGETRGEALARELREELGLIVDAARPLIRYRHDYPEVAVDLDVWQVTAWRGEPRGLEGQALKWVSADRLADSDLLPADRPVVTAVSLPDRYLVTGSFADEGEFETRLRAATARGVRLVQLRVPGADADTLETFARAAARICGPRSARLLINGEPHTAAGIALAASAAGVHMPSRYLAGLRRRPVPGGMMFGVSCHREEDLRAAARLGADFAVLGPVCPTGSHPGAPTMGLGEFARLVGDLPLPTYAIGGMKEADLPEAWDAGAQGIAAISGLW